MIAQKPFGDMQASLSSIVSGTTTGSTQVAHRLHAKTRKGHMDTYELYSKLLVSPLITPIVVPYIIPSIFPL